MDILNAKITEVTLQTTRAMLQLLIEKGIITEKELEDRIASLRAQTSKRADQMFQELFATKK